MSFMSLDSNAYCRICQETTLKLQLKCRIKGPDMGKPKKDNKIKLTGNLFS